MSFSSRGEHLEVGVKAKVMHSRMLTSDDYLMLLSSDSVDEVAEKLRRTSYAAGMASLPDAPHRNDVESSVKMTLIDEAFRLLLHLSSPRREFLRSWIRYHEADGIKLIFRRIASRDPEREDLRRRIYGAHFSSLPYDKMLEAKDFAELAHVLERTRYFSVLDEPLGRLVSGEEKTIFRLETALDRYMMQMLARARESLGEDEREPIDRMFGVNVDLTNLLVLFRARMIYKMPPERAMNTLSSARGKLRSEHLRAVSRAETRDGFVAHLTEVSPKFGEIFRRSFDMDEPMLMLGRNIARYRHQEADRVFRSGSPGFHTAMAYFAMKEDEIADIVRIIEIVRYGYDRARARTYMIRPMETGGDDQWL